MLFSLVQRRERNAATPTLNCNLHHKKQSEKHSQAMPFKIKSAHAIRIGHDHLTDLSVYMHQIVRTYA